MLKLINITKDDQNISADYIPENSQKQAHVKLSTTKDVYDVEVIDEFGQMYGSMALNGLRKILRELSDGKINELPKERRVVWF
ncbi:MAG: hypothetical protein NC120_12050 [Ruminococcus sp.]|nr:hypothetical protein [Ruminococcus sp.]